MTCTDKSFIINKAIFHNKYLKSVFHCDFIVRKKVSCNICISFQQESEMMVVYQTVHAKFNNFLCFHSVFQCCLSAGSFQNALGRLQISAFSKAYKASVGKILKILYKGLW